MADRPPARGSSWLFLLAIGVLLTAVWLAVWDSQEEVQVQDPKMAAQRIANSFVRTAPNGMDVKFSRLAAREISALQPVFKENNVRLIGVGVEPLGVEEFISGKFFAGELFIDMEKNSYKQMGFQRFGFTGLFSAVFGSAARAMQAKAKALGLGGDLKGDGYQNGGALVVEKGGKTLFTYVQETAADHASNEDILKALGINAPVKHAEDVSAPE